MCPIALPVRLTLDAWFVYCPLGKGGRQYFPTRFFPTRLTSRYMPSRSASFRGFSDRLVFLGAVVSNWRYLLHGNLSIPQNE